MGLGEYNGQAAGPLRNSRGAKTQISCATLKFNNRKTVWTGDRSQRTWKKTHGCHQVKMKHFSIRFVFTLFLHVGQSP